MFTPTFSISVYNPKTGNGMIDALASDKKTAKGAIKSSMRNTGNVLDTIMMNLDKKEFSIENLVFVARPVTSRDQMSNQSFTGSFPVTLLKQLNGIEVPSTEINW